jgi:thioredoxin reductase
MWRRRGDCSWWRKLSRPGSRVSGSNYEARAHARQISRFSREHVALPDSPDRSHNIVLRTHTEIVGIEGGNHLESVHWKNNQTGQTEEHKISHIFVMTGADPNTSWLDGCVALDDKGFIKTGIDLSPDNLSASGWRPTRQPYLLETSLPGVFVVGDVRGGSIKRVASAYYRTNSVLAYMPRY